MRIYHQLPIYKNLITIPISNYLYIKKGLDGLPFVMRKSLKHCILPLISSV